jgi:uncharacterized delta-60 repeat protein
MTSPALAKPGQLDPSFGNNGVAVVPIATGLVYKTLQQPDGKILVDGGFGTETEIVRLLPNGTIDTSFGNQGVVSFSVPNNEFQLKGDMQLQPNGSIVVVGAVNVPVPRGAMPHGVVLRLLPNGAPDTSFGAAGLVQLTSLGGPQTDSPNVLLLQPNGQILIADDFSSVKTSSHQVTRLNGNGSVDTTFGHKGIAAVPDATDRGNDGAPRALALQSDGKIIAIDSTPTVATEARLLSDGSIDKSTKAGTIVASTAAQAQISVNPPLALQSNEDYITEQTTGPQLAQFELDRFTPANTPNLFESPTIAFGPGVTNLSQDYANVVQPNGSIVVVGRFLVAPTEDFALARVLPTGALDTSFGSKGVVVTPLPGNDPLATAVALQADGNIVVAGDSGGQLTVARYLGK